MMSDVFEFLFEYLELNDDDDDDIMYKQVI